MRTQLLCTFTRVPKLNEIIDIIVSCNEILFDKIYVFSNQNDTTQLMCTYNVDATNAIDYNKVPGTISLHRKKFTNTLYTINGLNEVVVKLNDGLMDSKFVVPWEDFRNKLLITNAEGLKEIPTRIFKIVNIKEKK